MGILGSISAEDASILVPGEHTFPELIPGEQTMHDLIPAYLCMLARLMQ
jgi:hypothetical protein